MITRRLNNTEGIDSKDEYNPGRLHDLKSNMLQFLNFMQFLTAKFSMSALICNTGTIQNAQSGKKYPDADSCRNSTEQTKRELGIGVCCLSAA